MPNLSERQRARLPDSAFAYIDSSGRRRLPIHDRSHVKNALARFSRVTFEDEAARDRVRQRLIKAARRHGIVSDGFLLGQLEPHRKLPTGTVTFLMSDIEDSTGLLTRLGTGYAPLLAAVRRLLRTHVRQAGGHEVDARADEFLAAFAIADSALAAAVGAQQAIQAHAWPDEQAVRVRMGIHTGRPSLTNAGYVGLSVHAVSRVCQLAQGEQIVVSRAAVQALAAPAPDGIELRTMGEHRLRGLPQAMELFNAAS